MLKWIYLGAVLLSFCLLPTLLSAQTVSVTIVSVSSERGSVGIPVEVLLNNNIDISRVSIEIRYDGTILEATGVVAGQRVSEEPRVSFNWSSPSSGVVRVSVGTQFGIALGPGRGTLAIVQFDVADDAPVGDALLNLSKVAVFTPPNEPVPATSVNGTFSVFILPHLGLSEGSHDFGGILVGSSAEWMLTVFNAGTDTLIVNKLTATRSEFALDLPDFPQILDVDSSFDVLVTFRPQKMAVVSGLLNVRSNDPDSSVFSIPVTGEGILPDIALSESSYDYGQVPLGAVSEWMLMMYNVGTAPLAVTEVALDQANFSVVSPSFPKVIGAEDSLEVIIAFTTNSEGAVSATLTILSTDPDEGYLTVSLSARGIKAPDIEVSTTEYDFGQLLVDASITGTIPIANVGSAELTIHQITIDASEFLVISPVFPHTIPTGELIEVSLFFNVSREGEIVGHMTIESDDPDEGTVIVTLSGVGVVPDIELPETSHDYGEVVIGTSSDWVLPLANTGSGPLTVYSVSTDHSDFSITSPLFPQNVASGANLEVTITYTPSVEGSASATVSITSNDPDERTTRVSLSGEALLPTLELSALTHDFGDVYIDSLAVWTFTMTNAGSAPLTVEKVESNHADITVASPLFPQTIDLSESIDVSVHFVPTSQGSVAAQMTIHSNDPVNDPVFVDLTGIGAPPVTLRLEQITGEPGTEGVIMPVILENIVPLAQVEFSLHYDPTILTVTDVARSGQGIKMGTFNWSHIEPGQVVILLSDFTGQVISPDTGSIADLSVTVVESAPPEIVTLLLTGVAVFDSLGQEYEFRTFNGIFTVEVEDIHVPVDDYDFGDVGVGVPSEWSLTIVNKGTKDLDIDSLRSDNPDFHVPDVEYPSICPSGEVDVLISFSPSVVGESEGHVRIFSSDPDEKVFTVTVRGVGIAAAVLQVSDGSGDVGSSDNPVGIHLQNLMMDVYGLECVLSFDSEKLSVTDVQPTGRSEGLDLFNWTTPTEGQIRIVMSGLGHTLIPIGDGSVAEVFFTVDQGAPREIIALSLSGAAVFDSSGRGIVTAAMSGFFQITGADILLKETEHTFEYVAPGDSGVWHMVLFNEGTSTLVLDNISSTHSYFEVSAPEFPQTVFMEDSLAVTVLYIPSDTGTVVGSLLVSSNDPEERMLTVPLTGRSAFPDISVPVRDYSFGAVEVGESDEWRLTLFNQSLVTLTISAISTVPSEFEVAWPTRFPHGIPPNGNSGVIIRFSPSDTGTVSGTVEIMSNDPDEPSLIISLSGKGGVLVPDIAVSSVGHDFGKVMSGSSADWIFSISNEGLVDLTVQSVVSSSEEFDVVSPHFPLIIESNAMIPVSVLFTPSSLDLFEGTIIINSDDPDEAVVMVTLMGEGVTTPIPEISLSAYSHFFGSVPMGQISDWELDISNEGTDSLKIHSVRVSHTEFSIVTPEFPLVVPPSVDVELVVRFGPLSVGHKEGQVILASNDPDEDTVTVNVSGEGLPSLLVPHIALSDSEHNFGSVKIGDEATWSFQISNTGQTDLIVNSVQSDHSDFHLSSPEFPISVPPGGDGRIEVLFKPTSVGAKAGALAILSNDPDHPMMYVQISGKGEALVAVQLLSFTATCSRNKVILTWHTRSEIDLRGFQVLRREASEPRFHVVTEDGLMNGSSPYRFVDNSLKGEGVYHYQLVAVNNHAQESIVGYTSVEVNSLIPSAMILSQNYPNPFNPETKIEYVLDEKSWVDLSVFNLLGQRVKTLVAHFQHAGYHSVVWNGIDEEGQPVHSGVYITTLKVGGHIETIKMMFLK